MSEASVQILLAVYFGTLILSILIAAIQYVADRKPTQRAILIYWLGHTVSTLGNGLFTNLDMKTVMAAASGSLVSLLFLGSFFANIHRVRVPWWPFVLLFAAAGAMSFGLEALGFGFTIFALPMIIASTAVPIFAHLILVYRRKTRPFTTMQILFVVTASLMGLHYLDWPFTRPHPGFFFWGMALAIALLHVLSILTPLMANEASLQERNEKLEDEVQRRLAQLRSVEHHLWQAENMASLGRMAGGVAHEINSPLQVIGLEAEELQARIQRESVADGEIEQAMAHIQQMVARISGITEGLRKVARDKRPVEMRPFDLAEATRELLPAYAKKMGAREIRFTSTLPEKEVPVVGNPSEIAQIIMNLLDNALQAVEALPTKEVHLMLADRDAKAEVAVTDSGQIDPKIIPLLMQPFFSTHPPGKGIGLGLSVSKSIAESHNGSLYLDRGSRNTRFVLELPIRRA